MARKRKTSRKGTRPRIGVAMRDYWTQFSATDAQWRELEKALGKSIPSEARERIGKATTEYISEGQAERNAPYVDDHKKRLAKTEQFATRLLTLLFHGTAQIDVQAAGVALAGLDGFIPAMDDGEDVIKALHDAPYVETKTLAFENALRRVTSNCCKAIRRADAPGFSEHKAWDAWILALLTVLREAGLPPGVATPAYDDNHSPTVRFVHALQRLLPVALRRHDLTLIGLAKAMRAARARAQKRKKAKVLNPK